MSNNTTVINKALLDACKVMLDHMQSIDDEGDQDTEWSAMVNQARAAIAKATGENQ